MTVEGDAIVLRRARGCPDWLARLDLESCEGCGGQVRVIACIEDPGVIARLLAHLDRHSLRS